MNNERFLKYGEGWRIGWNENAHIYKGLIGAEDWAIELTAQEMREFCRLLSKLAQNMTEMKDYLMDEEKITCEIESELMWLEVEGYYNSYSLRLILNQGRCCEGNWTPEAVKEFIIAIHNFNVF
jgi:hypothetical protein